MFDITSSKLLLLAIVALLVIGPKDFPLLLRTIGKYVGIIRGYAKEFRAQFDEAARESELAQIKKDIENIGQETEATLNATGQSVEKSVDAARQSVEATLGPDPLAHDANGVPLAAPAPAEATASAANGAPPAPEAPPASETPAAGPEPAPAVAGTAPEPAPAAAVAPTAPAPAPEKIGA